VYRSFWKNSVAKSLTGHFSFWLNKNHVVGISGEAVRKMFLENSDLNRITAAHLHGVGPEIVPPIHPIFRTDSKNGHTYFQRRVLDLMKSGHLAKCLPLVMKDSHVAFDSLVKDSSGFLDPIDVCYHLVLTQSARVVCTDEISNNPSLMTTYLAYTRILQHTSSGYIVAVPWFPSWAHMKRRYCRAGLNRLVGPIVDRRMQKNAQRKDDTLQMLIDMGDSADYIKTFFISILFISVGNAGKLAGGLLNFMAQKPEWQEKIYREVKEAAAAHSPKKDLPLLDQLGLIPLEAWESSFPSIELCFRESIRMHVAFPMIRQNTSPRALLIPGSNEVIPPGSFVAYNTGDVHYNEKLYPNARNSDPNRFLEEREGHKKESYGCKHFNKP
jgi:cytochrome P450